jgi:hypothetical protein
MAALDTLVNPPFANNPPVKLNLDAKVVGLVVAILGGLGALFAFLGLLGLLGVGAALSAFAGIFFLALIGVILNLVARRDGRDRRLADVPGKRERQTARDLRFGDRLRG